MKKFDISLAHAYIFLKIIILCRKAFKLQHDSSVTQNVSPKTQITAQKLKITLTNTLIFSFKKNPE